LPVPEIERTVASAACTILSDKAAIAEAANSIGVAEIRLPSIFSVAAAWMKRLQSEVEVEAALTVLIERVDLIDTGLRVSLKLPIAFRGTAAQCERTCAHYRADLPDADQASRVRNASAYPRQSRPSSIGRSRTHQGDRSGTPMG
jgi:hypothetical protein